MKLPFKIWLLIFFLIFSLISIFGIPPKVLSSGVIVSSIDVNSTLYDQGLRQGDVIVSVDGKDVKDLDSYFEVVSAKFLSGQDEVLALEIKDGSEFTFYGKSYPKLSVEDISKTNLELGLDLAGGARALVRAQNHTLSESDVDDLVEITSNRFNAFGLTDMEVSPVKDLSGNNFMLIEIAGATPSDLEQLISQQGEFVAKVGNVTVFEGGDKDIASVGRDAQTARIESCSESSSGYVCSFVFAITLSPDAAEKMANVTSELSINHTSNGNYLSKDLDLFLDGNYISSLKIGESLKGRVTTQISISGSEEGETYEEALANAKAEMKKLQTILMTGSLPYQLEIVKLDTISPILGEDFMNYILLAGLVAILSVAVILFIRYKSWKSSLAIIVTTTSEIIIVLGIAAFIQWNLDLPSIAGILAAIGTGVDDLVVLMDETGSGLDLGMKQRLKRAFFIIMGAYFTSLVSLLPLMWAGAGLLKGFAITTIIGISAGVFITRPAFGDFLKKFRH